MKLAIMQPYLFPYIGYFQLINAVDKFVIYDDVAFIKQGWINRNNILLKGQKYPFSFPVKTISSFSAINDTYISDKPFNWQKKFLSTIEQAYRKATFFDNVFPLIKTLVDDCSNKSIGEVATESILMSLRYLEIKVKVVPSSSAYNNHDLKGKDRILDICLKEDADTYVNVIAGAELYKREDFKAIGKDLIFIKPLLQQYEQYKNDFVPALSIIDAMMFCSVAEIRNMLSKYSL